MTSTSLNILNNPDQAYREPKRLDDERGKIEIHAQRKDDQTCTQCVQYRVPGFINIDPA